MNSLVMAGLVPAIHVFKVSSKKDADARDKPGHDERLDSGAIEKIRRKQCSRRIIVAA
ncbi:hypothetical protein [Bradyrhizobium sp.]|jgi:hypothetical protein|uniref:hypothetical protein n=1 Tax=Bradyrhizobium sp. TaxID=376 RepID=UPI002DFC39DF|nr:hypothetical protein [Bradyrhizobium sp.]